MTPADCMPAVARQTCQHPFQDVQDVGELTQTWSQVPRYWLMLTA